MKEPIILELGGVRLTVSHGEAVVSLEINNKWVEVIKEKGETVSHIIEPSGIRRILLKQP